MLPIVKGPPSIKPGSEDESSYLDFLVHYLKLLDPLEEGCSVEKVNWMSSDIAKIFSVVWNKFFQPSRAFWRLKSWWDSGCAAVKALAVKEGTPDSWTALKNATRIARHKYFDCKVKEVAFENKRPWDLMSWVGSRNTPSLRGCLSMAHPVKQRNRSLRPSIPHLMPHPTVLLHWRRLVIHLSNLMNVSGLPSLYMRCEISSQAALGTLRLDLIM